MAAKKPAQSGKKKVAKKMAKRRRQEHKQVVGLLKDVFGQQPDEARNEQTADAAESSSREPPRSLSVAQLHTACDNFLRALEKKEPKSGILVQCFEGRITGFLFTEDVDDPPGWGVLLGRAEGFRYRHYPLLMPSQSGAQEVLRGLTKEVKSVVILAAFQAGRQSVYDERLAKSLDVEADRLTRNSAKAEGNEKREKPEKS